jgi:hypothetical protein
MVNRLLILIFCSVLFGNAFGQQNDEIVRTLNERGEVCFSFEIKDKQELKTLTKIISIDYVSGNYVRAYANAEEFARFEKLGYKLELIRPLSLKGLKTAATTDDLKTWDVYPTYQQYLDLMQSFQTNYPNLCRIDTIGKTTNGRLLLAAKISDNVNQKEAEPEVFYTSSMHGDELTGYVLMLRLIDDLLTNASLTTKSTKLARELVQNLEIYINPLANPDGTYAGGDNTVSSARRGNANYIDFNRNFPDPAGGNHPDGNSWQKETIAFMDFAKAHNFVLSANFHGGAEVINYPWDTYFKRHPDDAWFQFVSKNYADSAKRIKPTYLSDVAPVGYINGYDWYSIEGGRQDYMNYFGHCREVTIELSIIKTPASTSLPDFWAYNYASFLNYLDQARYGIQGTITDKETGNPIRAKVRIVGHDADSSEVYSTASLGDYYRPIAPGNWTVEISAPGYVSQTISNIQTANYTATRLDAQLTSTKVSVNEIEADTAIKIWPNPVSDYLFVRNIDEANIQIWIFDITGKLHFRQQFSAQEDIHIDVKNLPSGIYFLRYQSSKQVKTMKFVKEGNN